MQFESRLEEYYFERHVLDLAIRTLENGQADAHPATHDFVRPRDAWNFPKYPGLTVVVAPDADLAEAFRDFILDNQTPLAEADTWLSAWINPHTQFCYIYIATALPDLADARRAALEAGERDGRKIVALYNPVRDETVYL